MKNTVTRRDFLVKVRRQLPPWPLRMEYLDFPRRRASADDTTANEKGPIRLGLASHTFRNFSRVQLIGSMKQLRVTALNTKDTKDHLPTDPAAGVRSACRLCRGRHHAARRRDTIYFDKNDEADIRGKFAYCKRVGIGVIVAGDPTPETCSLRVEKFAKEYDMRIAIHNHGPEDKLWHSPLDVLEAVKNMDARMVACIDVRHTVRAGTDVVEAIHAAGARLFNVHMKDLTDFQKKDSQVAVGEGRMPVKKIFEALVAINYRESFVDLELRNRRWMIPCLVLATASLICVAFLAGMGCARRPKRFAT